MKVSSFEDLQVWQDSRKLVKSIYELTSTGNFSKDYGLKDQIQRASVSIMNNIAEGFERNNNKEYTKYLGYSKGSAGEVRSMLCVALDLGYISKDNFIVCYDSSLNVITQISNFTKYLNKYSIKEKFENIKLLLVSLIRIKSFNL